jgi:hypothetical protein
MQVVSSLKQTLTRNISSVVCLLFCLNKNRQGELPIIINQRCGYKLQLMAALGISLSVKNVENSQTNNIYRVLLHFIMLGRNSIHFEFHLFDQ